MPFYLSLNQNSLAGYIIILVEVKLVNTWFDIRYIPFYQVVFATFYCLCPDPSSVEVGHEHHGDGSFVFHVDIEADIVGGRVRECGNFDLRCFSLLPSGNFLCVFTDGHSFKDFRLTVVGCDLHTDDKVPCLCKYQFYASRVYLIDDDPLVLGDDPFAVLRDWQGYVNEYHFFKRDRFADPEEVSLQSVGRYFEEGGKRSGASFVIGYIEGVFPFHGSLQVRGILYGPVRGFP